MRESGAMMLPEGCICTGTVTYKDCPVCGRTGLITLAGLTVACVWGLNSRKDRAMERLCCELVCKNPATHIILHGASPDDYTEACIDHISDLMTDADRHEIIKIPDDDTAKSKGG